MMLTIVPFPKTLNTFAALSQFLTSYALTYMYIIIMSHPFTARKNLQVILTADTVSDIAVKFLVHWDYISEYQTAA